MPQRRNKNESVRLQFERFSEICSCIPAGMVEILEDTQKDPPDVSIGESKLGIEFVDFIHGSKPDGGSEQRAAEEVFKNIIKRAEREFLKNTDTPLYVNFLWNHVRPQKREIAEIIQNILKLVNRSIPTGINQRIEIRQEEYANTILGVHLRQISVSRLPIEGYSSWFNMGSGNTLIGVQTLENCVRMKEEGLIKYEKDFETLWLVIVATGNSISTSVMKDGTVIPGCITSKFDRVYFYDGLHREVICLTGSEN